MGWCGPPSRTLGFRQSALRDPEEPRIVERDRDEGTDDADLHAADRRFHRSELDRGAGALGDEERGLSPTTAFAVPIPATRSPERAAAGRVPRPDRVHPTR